jgi:ubiquinone/menaquinone biosynthesis C-methylase UbiE
MSANPQQVAAGQAIYSARTLAVYDFLVLGLSNRLIWRCPSALQVEHYNRHVSANHLDVGVGTGHFLDRCRFPSHAPRIALMDLNRNSLEYSSKRIARFRPEAYVRNVLEPISFDAEKFDSVGANYLLHCLPGSIETKAVALDHLKSLMKPNGVLFGATILQGGVERNLAARRLMEFYNKKGIFSNESDDLRGLEQSLNRRFNCVSIQIRGCVALFSGRA